MMIAVVILLASLVLVSALGLMAYASHARTEIVRLKHLSRWRDEFFISVNQFLESDPRMPEKPLRFVQALVLTVDHSNSPRILLNSISPLTLMTSDELKEQQDVFDFRVQRMEVRKTLAKIGRNYILAVSFNDRYLGPKIRSTAAEIFGDPNEKTRAKETEAVITRVIRDRPFDGLGACAAAA